MSKGTGLFSRWSWESWKPLQFGEYYPFLQRNLKAQHHLLTPFGLLLQHFDPIGIQTLRPSPWLWALPSSELYPVLQSLKLTLLPFVWTGCDWSEPGLLEPLMGDVFGLLLLFLFPDFLQLTDIWTSLVAQTVKNLSEMQETQVCSLGQEDPLEKEMATHSSILTWRIPWIEDPGGLQSMGLWRVGHDWATNTHTHTHTQQI